MEHDENTLVRSAVAGDDSACEALVGRYSRMVGTVIWRATGDEAIVEDLAQETFIKVFRALASFDGRGKLSTWIYTIAHRVAVDHLRKTGRWKMESLTQAHDDGTDPVEKLPLAGGMDPEAELFRAEAGRLVRDGLRQLPDKYRVPLVYAAIEGLDYATIAEMMHMPMGTLKTLVFRGKQMLKQKIIAAVAATPEGRGSREL